MEITFDPTKNARNIRERGLSFEQAADFEIETTMIRVDDRFDYGETRFHALGYLEGRLHSLTFVETEKGIRVVSLRKANRREAELYETQDRS